MVDDVDDVDAAVDATILVQLSIPRQNDRENIGVPPLRFMEMYLASIADKEVK